MLGNLFYILHTCSYIHGTLVSPDSDTTKPMKSPAEHNETLAEEVEGGSKDELRRAVESLFNTLYGMMYHLIYYISDQVYENKLCLHTKFASLFKSLSVCEQWLSV